MTDVDGVPPPGEPVAQEEVASSLSTLGYAMFAFLDPGPLEGIPSMPEFLAQSRREEEAARAAAEAAAFALANPPAPAFDPEDSFGHGNSGPVTGSGPAPQTQPVEPEPAPAAPASGGGWVPPPIRSGFVPPVGGVTRPAEDTYVPDEEPTEAEPEPEEAPAPEPVKPAPTGNEFKRDRKVLVLNEISFLDE